MKRDFRFYTTEEAEEAGLAHESETGSTCPHCGEALEDVDILSSDGTVRWVMCSPCGCEGSKAERDTELEREREEQLKASLRALASAMERSGIPRRYHRARVCMAQSAAYIEHFGEVEGRGLYLFGRCGSGKTAEACAIARAFLESGYSVTVTTTLKMLDAISKSYGEDGSDAEVDDSLAAMPYGEYRLTELRCDANAGLQLVGKTFWVERDSTAAKAAWLDIDDHDEPEKKIGTKATDGEDGDKSVASDIRAKVVDLVSYAGLNPGVEHTVSGTLMVKSTGEPLKDASGAPVTASTTFTPERADGTVEVVFEFDTSLIAGEKVVVFESVRERGIEVAVHTDIDDEGQTVKLIEPSKPGEPGKPGNGLPKTGDDMPLIALACLAAAAGCASGVIALSKRRKGDGEDEDAEGEDA